MRLDVACALCAVTLLCLLPSVSAGRWSDVFDADAYHRYLKEAMMENEKKTPDKPTSPERQYHYTPARNYPGMAGFPTLLEFKILATSLKSEVLFPASEKYRFYAISYNLRVNKSPYAIVLAQHIEDVQKVMVFAKKHNMMVTIQSSGHSFIGRSTNDGCIQINFKLMKGRHVTLNSTRSEAGEITVESGNSWIDVYTEVDALSTIENSTKTGRVIVGGSAHTVAMGGYTMGGGHSPICRSLGLAVDSLLEATLVTVDGSVVTVSETGTVTKTLNGTVSENCDTSLFWAIRGGGGGVWGAVISFTIKLHYAPKRFRNVLSSWALMAGTEDQFGRDTVRYVLQQLNQLCPQWGGYMLVSGAPLDDTGFYRGSVTVFLNHFGSDNDSCTNDVDGLLNYNISGNQYAKTDKIFPTFLEYEKTAYDPPVINAYTVNTFVQPETITDPQKLEKLVDLMMKLGPSRSCTGVMLGGATNNAKPGSTPVNPAFRSGLMSLTCVAGWEFSFLNDTAYVDMALSLYHDLAKLGKGVYYNEPAEDLPDWKEMFWGSMDTYCKLAAIKRKVDPDNFLWCHNCVGSDFRFDCPKSYWWMQDNPHAYRRVMRGGRMSHFEYEFMKALRTWP